MVTLLHRGRDRDNIRNWRSITFLNTDYKIISKLLANGTKLISRRLIHSDQTGFVEGRNISESNRMIDDIINYVDEEDQAGIIVFVDQEIAYDRVEWGWVNHVLKGFNFGSKFCGWIQMLSKNAKTCINTTGFISTFFSLTRLARQECSVAPLLYIIQAELMDCAIRGTDEIKGYKCLGVKMFLNRKYVCLPMKFCYPLFLFTCIYLFIFC